MLRHQLVEKATALSVNAFATVGESVLSSVLTDMTQLMPCTHEEADTRIMIHCRDAVLKGHTSITIRTVDSDVVSIAVSMHDDIGA